MSEPENEAEEPISEEKELSGVPVVDIVSKAEVVKNPYLVSIMMGLLQMSSDIILVFDSSRIGRRRRIGVISGIGISFSLAVLGIYNYLFESTNTKIVQLASVLIFVIMFSMLALLNLVPTGMSVAYSAIALPYLNDTMDINLTNQEPTLFASIPSIFMLVGCITSIYTLTLGRRLAISLGSLTNVLGWTLIASSYNVPQLLIGRVIAGFAMGLCTVPGVAYISEMTTIKLAPTLNSCSSLFISLGALLIYLLGYVFKGKWRIVAGCSVLVSVISTLSTTIFLPESPRWLLIKNQEEKARKSLLRLRGLKIETQEFQTEFDNMVAYNKYGEKETRDKEGSIINTQVSGSGQSKNISVFRKLWLNVQFLVSIMKLPEVWKPFLILNSFFFFQQFCGIYVISAYAVKVVSNAGITQDPFLVTVMFGILQICGELGQILSSSRLGRRKTSIISGFGMTISITTLGAYNQFFSDTKLSLIPLASILAFVALGTFGFINLPWSMIGELYPTRYVHVLGPVTTCLCGLFNFSTLYLYPTLLQFGPVISIYFYSICSIAATIFVITALPETVGKSKMEIEEKFKRKKPTIFKFRFNYTLE